MASIQIAENNDVETLWRAYKERHSRKAREALILHYLGLVKYIIHRLTADSALTVRTEDLVNSGVIGLIDAMEKFDPHRGIKFSTYAIARIKGAILDELRRLDWMPREVRTKAKEIERIARELESKINRRPTEEELARELNIRVEELEELYRRISSVSLLPLEGGWPGRRGQRDVLRIERIKNEESVNPESAVEKKELKKLIDREIKALPDKERAVIIRYYYDEMTLKEIGRMLELSESRVSQIHSKVILALRRRIKEWEQITY